MTRDELVNLAEEIAGYQRRGDLGFVKTESAFALATAFIELDKRVDELEAALDTIQSAADDEIKARFGHTDPSPKMYGKSRLYSLLAVPRNIARAALGDKQNA